jgi:hypothetical protein
MKLSGRRQARSRRRRRKTLFLSEVKVSLAAKRTVLNQSSGALITSSDRVENMHNKSRNQEPGHHNAFGNVGGNNVIAAEKTSPLQQSSGHTNDANPLGGQRS